MKLKFRPITDLTGAAGKEQLNAYLKDLYQNAGELLAALLPEHREKTGDGYVEGYYKYPDGRLECYKVMSYASLDITTTWGNVYISSAIIDAGDFAHPFTSLHEQHAFPTSANYSLGLFSCFENTMPSLTKWSPVQAWRGKSGTPTGVTVYFYAKGRWK